MTPQIHALPDTLGLAHAFGDGGIVVALLVAGLVGGVTHCAGMCGPFVLGQTTARLAATPADRFTEMTRLRGALLVPYHLGRATTYAVLGAAAAVVVGRVAPHAGGWLPATFLFLAAALFAVAGLRGFGLRLPASDRVAAPSRPVALGARDGFVKIVGARFHRLLGALFARPTGLRGYLLGVTLGFLPCGLLYAALAAAAAAREPALAALAMAAFSLGTAPALIAVGLAGHFMARRFLPAFRLIAPALLIVNGLALSWLAWGLIA